MPALRRDTHRGFKEDTGANNKEIKPTFWEKTCPIIRDNEARRLVKYGS